MTKEHFLLFDVSGWFIVLCSSYLLFVSVSGMLTCGIFLVRFTEYFQVSGNIDRFCSAITEFTNQYHIFQHKDLESATSSKIISIMKGMSFRSVLNRLYELGK